MWKVGQPCWQRMFGINAQLRNGNTTKANLAQPQEPVQACLPEVMLFEREVEPVRAAARLLLDLTFLRVVFKRRAKIFRQV